MKNSTALIAGALFFVVGCSSDNTGDSEGSTENVNDSDAMVWKDPASEKDNEYSPYSEDNYPNNVDRSIRCRKVRVWETPSNSAWYEGASDGTGE